MRIDRRQNTISFKRELTPTEEKEYVKILHQAKETVGQTGDSVLIMPTSSLPQTKTFNSGVGHLSSDIAQNYLKYMQTYYGINAVEDLPSGQIYHNADGFYCHYNSSSLELGVNHINPELLTTDEFEHLLTSEDLKAISDGNNSAIKENFANFKNVIDKDSSTDKALQKAFQKFKTLSETSPLQIKYQRFVSENNDWLEFPRTHEPDTEFFKFKQFLAEEHHKIGKTKTNLAGIKVWGDCPIGFSEDEIKAFPDAFYQDKTLKIGEWHKQVLNYEDILKNPDSPAFKLFKRKIQLAAKRYDKIRMDVGWSYITPKLTANTGEAVPLQLNSRLLYLIEKWVKEVQGDSFDSKNILYEVEAGADDFRAFDNKGLIAPLQNRLKVYTSVYMHDNAVFDRWGYTKAFSEKGMSLDEILLGPGNHDSQPLRLMAKGIADNYAPMGQADHKTGALKVLSKIFNISQDVLKNPVEFAKAKFAEPLMGKNYMVFFADVFGMEEIFNKHGDNHKFTPEKNFAIKVPTDFKTTLHQAIQEGYGFNIMDSLEKVFRAKGYDQTHPDLFKQIVRYKEILYSPPKKRFELTKGKLGIIAAIGGALGVLSSFVVMMKNYKNEKNTVIAKKPENKQLPPTPSVKIDDLLVNQH